MNGKWMNDLAMCKWMVRKWLELDLTNQPTSMEQSPSWEANRYSASQEIPWLLWKLEVHYHVHKSPNSEALRNIS